MPTVAESTTGGGASSRAPPTEARRRKGDSPPPPPPPCAAAAAAAGLSECLLGMLGETGEVMAAPSEDEEDEEDPPVVVMPRSNRCDPQEKKGGPRGPARRPATPGQGLSRDRGAGRTQPWCC